MNPKSKERVTGNLQERAQQMIVEGETLESVLAELYPQVEGVVGLSDVMGDREIHIYLEKSNEVLGALGYTEHGSRHHSITAYRAGWILCQLGYSPREQELAAIAGYMHDIGGVVNRQMHEQSGAIISGSILKRLGMETEERIECMMAIGNHDEKTGEPVTPITAALILADKSDVHRSRVRNPSMISFDIHDRVNYAVLNTNLLVNAPEDKIKLSITIDTKISHVMEYFEIFLTRMIISRKAARKLGLSFILEINDVEMS